METRCPILKDLFDTIQDRNLPPEERKIKVQAALKGLEELKAFYIEYYKKTGQPLDLSLIPNIDSIYQKSNTLFNTATFADDIPVATLLLEAKADPYIPTTSAGRTALCWAAYEGKTEMVLFLLKHLDLKRLSDSGHTPLAWAARFGHELIVEYLHKAGADLQQPDQTYSLTPLQWACFNGHLNTVRYLLNAGAMLNETYYEDLKTSLEYAVQGNHLAVVALLLQHNAEIENINVFRDFLAGQDQSDIHVMTCLQILSERSITIVPQNQRGELDSYKNTLQIIHRIYSDLLRSFKQSSLPDNLFSLIMDYNASFFTTSRVTFFQTVTAQNALLQLKNEMKALPEEKTENTVIQDGIQQINAALNIQDYPEPEENTSLILNITGENDPDDERNLQTLQRRPCCGLM